MDAAIAEEQIAPGWDALMARALQRLQALEANVAVVGVECDFGLKLIIVIPPMTSRVLVDEAHEIVSGAYLASLWVCQTCGGHGVFTTLGTDVQSTFCRRCLSRSRRALRAGGAAHLVGVRNTPLRQARAHLRYTREQARAGRAFTLPTPAEQ